MKQEMRFTGAGCTDLSGAIERALSMPGGLTIENLRSPGFRALEQHLADDGFRTLAPLPDNAQRIIDDSIVEVGMDRLTLMADVMAAGLTFNLTDPLSITQIDCLSTNKAAT